MDDVSGSPTVSPHVLYRFFDSESRLLYIGRTWNPTVRMSQHQRKQPWWADVAHVAIEQFDSDVSVRQAERRAIVAKRPLHNIALNRRYAKSEEQPEPVGICLLPTVRLPGWVNALNRRERDMLLAMAEGLLETRREAPDPEPEFKRGARRQNLRPWDDFTRTVHDILGADPEPMKVVRILERLPAEFRPASPQALGFLLRDVRGLERVSYGPKGDRCYTIKKPAKASS